MSGDLALGYSCCLIAGVGFGINYLPVKGIDTGDGIFFSAVMSVGILIVGLVAGMALSSPPGLGMAKFEPWAAFGGAIWMVGNLMCPYIIKLIGMGLGLTVWDLSNMIMGWFTGQFGLFGVKKEHVDRPLANCVGLGLALSSLIFFSVAARCDAQGPEDVVAKAIAECPEKAAKPSEACEAGPGSQISEESLSTTCPESSVSQIDLENQVSRASGNSTPCKSANLVLGLSMALFAGLLFGTTFDLPTALMQGTFGEDHSKMIMDYVFSHFCGIFGTASLALVIYAAVLRKRRHMPRRMILPAIASGVLWGIAQVAWFQANIDLGFAVAFPIIGSLPGIVGLIIGMACFGEVKSCKGRVWACLGMALRVPGVLLIAIST
ncbi:TMEM144 [Symbiodinium natans]|uniref:TMEM144 protein n=1 Tax=Symbiodinium natans TaxID=878477 RepID=A0A812R372_9DINO|nr:TMEM144 [Symbiodinium natans]